MQKPEGYEEYLGPFGECLFDSKCGECVAWGFEIVKRMDEELFKKLKQEHTLECRYPTWYVIVKVLGHNEAVEKYGPASLVMRGPRGGFKWIMFGVKKFSSKFVDPDKQALVDEINQHGS